MEQFTRECLEVDKDSKGEKSHGLFVGTSMEQIYERAARLVHRTLDLEGAVVMDVSHVDVLETFGAESSTSISIHHADPQLGTITRSLCQDEHAKLHEFFARHPDGKISEGVVPVGLRPFLPSRIQYALSKCALRTLWILINLLISCADLQHRQASIRCALRLQHRGTYHAIRKFVFDVSCCMI